MKKSIALLALSLLFAACTFDGGPQDTAAGDRRPSRSAPSPTPVADASQTSAETPAAAGELEVWFTQGDRLFVSRRSVPDTPAVGRAAMEQLLARPDDFESNSGVTSAIPAGVELLGLTISDGVATVDLSDGFGQGGGSTGELLSVAQVVYTLTQFPTVTGVLFEVEGRPLRKTPGHGLLLSGPQTRRDWQDQLPPILVTKPAMSDQISSPVAVEGTADVFEATVQMRLLDAAGEPLARAFTTASCGTGCRGDFTHELTFEVDHEQHGVLEVWWDSPEDGSRKDVVRVPVTLLP